MDSKVVYRKFIIDCTVTNTGFSVTVGYRDGDIIAQQLGVAGKLKTMMEWAKRTVDTHIEIKSQLHKELKDLKLDWVQEMPW